MISLKHVSRSKEQYKADIPLGVIRCSLAKCLGTAPNLDDGTLTIRSLVNSSLAILALNNSSAISISLSILASPKKFTS
jgi:hypothetical protein